MGGLTNLLLLLCVGVTVSAVLDLQRRIIVDHTCKVNERLYHVKLTSTKGIQYIPCGGSLISKSWILTAAHCWRDGWTIWAKVGQGRSVKITANPEIFKDAQNRDHDIMLLKLPDSTQVNHIIPLPRCGQQPAENEKVYVAGHGPSTPGSNKLTKTLQCAEMTVSPCEVGDAHPEPDKYMFCGKTPKGQTPQVKICSGDSGGGVVYKGKIYGVIRSSEEPDVCYPEAGFMKVCEYIDWINEKIELPKLTGPG